MRLAVIFLYFSLTISCFSSGEYPAHKPPPLSLINACLVVDKMLDTQGDKKSFHCIGARLSMTGWNLDYSNRRGERLWASLIFSDDYAHLVYLAKDGNNLNKVVKFSRDGQDVKVKKQQTSINKQKKPNKSEQHDRLPRHSQE